MLHTTLDNIDYVIARNRGGFAELVAPDGSIRFIPSAQLGQTTPRELPIIPGPLGTPFPLRPKDFIRELQERRLRALATYTNRTRKAKSTDPDAPARSRGPNSAIKGALGTVPAELHENLLKALASRKKK